MHAQGLQCLGASRGGEHVESGAFEHLALGSQFLATVVDAKDLVRSPAHR
jgi:hypothetical protein